MNDEQTLYTGFLDTCCDRGSCLGVLLGARGGPNRGSSPHCDARGTGSYLTAKRDVYASANRYAEADRQTRARAHRYAGANGHRHRYHRAHVDSQAPTAQEHRSTGLSATGMGLYVGEAAGR
jgi:hypothetical protein